MNRVVTVGLLLYVSTVFTSAQIQLTEIMYDPSGSDTGREWIEVQNTGGSTIDFTTWKFFEANVNHGIDQIEGYPKDLQAGEFGVVVSDKAKFLIDFPNFSGKLFKSSFSFSNTGETLAFKNDTDVIVDQYSYDSTLGAAGDGNSLYKGSSWSAALPTPGIATSGSDGGGQTGNISGTTQNVGTAATTNPVVTGSGSVYVAPQLSGTITTPSIAFAGVETVLHAKAFISGGKDVQNPQFSWNFGDGTVGYGPSVRHIYKYPGTYHIALGITAPTENNSIPVLEHGSLIVVAPEIAVSEGRDENGGTYVVLENKTKYLLDVSSWIIQRGGFSGERYTLPKNTFIGAFASVRISEEVTLFKNDGIQRGVEILFPNRVIAAHYNPAPVIAQTTPALVSLPIPPAPRLKTYASSEATAPKLVLAAQQTNAVVPLKIDVSSTLRAVEEPAQTGSATATASTSMFAAIGTLPEENNPSFLWYIVLLLLITIMGGIYLVTKKESTLADEYTITDDGK